MICVPKLVTHPTEDANVESPTENMDEESSREIESPSSHDISNQRASKFHLFQDLNEIY